MGNVTLLELNDNVAAFTKTLWSGKSDNPRQLTLRPVQESPGRLSRNWLGHIQTWPSC